LKGTRASAREPEGLRERRGRVQDHENLDLSGIHRRDEVGHSLRAPGRRRGGGRLRSEEDRLADVAGDVIEDAHRHGEGRRVRVLDRNAARQGQRGARVGEFIGEPPDGPCGHARRLRHLLGRVRRQVQARHGVARLARGGDGLGHREREQHLGAGYRGDPLVRAGRGEREPRIDGHEARHLPVRPGVRPGELPAVLEGRVPGVEELGAEGKDELRAGDGVPGDLVPAKGESAPLAQGLQSEGLEHHAVGRPRRREPLAAERVEAAGELRREEPHARTVPRVPERRHLVGERLEGGVPGDLLESGAGLLHRAREAIGVVQPLERGLPAGAERAAVHGVLRVTLDLDGAPFPAFTWIPAGRAPRQVLA
jgi:hypothetical protein